MRLYSEPECANWKPTWFGSLRLERLREEMFDSRWHLRTVPLLTLRNFTYGGENVFMTNIRIMSFYRNPLMITPETPFTIWPTSGGASILSIFTVVQPGGYGVSRLSGPITPVIYCMPLNIQGEVSPFKCCLHLLWDWSGNRGQGTHFYGAEGFVRWQGSIITRHNYRLCP